MKRTIFCAFILTALSFSSRATETSSNPPKATICYSSNAMRVIDQQPMSCKGLGKFNSIDELYQRGYRVVSSGVIPEPGSTIYLIVERIDRQ